MAYNKFIMLSQIYIYKPFQYHFYCGHMIIFIFLRYFIDHWEVIDGSGQVNAILNAVLMYEHSCSYTIIGEDQCFNVQHSIRNGHIWHC